MTVKDILPKPSVLAERIWIWLTSIMLSAVGVIMLSILTPVGSHIAAVWAVPGEMAALRGQIADLAEG